MNREQRIAALIRRSGYEAAGLAAFPIPGTEYLAVLPIHVGMVIGIGREYGQELTKEVALKLLRQIGTTVRISLISTSLATTAGKIVLPGFGGVAAAPFVFASTLALGRVANLYFQRQGTLDKSEIKREFGAEMKRATSAFDARKVASPEGPNHQDADFGIEDEANSIRARSRPAGGFAQTLRALRARLDTGEISPSAHEREKRHVVETSIKQIQDGRAAHGS